MDNNFDDVFGVAGKNETLSKRTYLSARKLKEGETVVARVVPPFKSNRSIGRWAKRHGVHWGFKRTNKKDVNGSPWIAPFLCIEERDWKTKMVTQNCPQCTSFEEQSNTLKKLESDIENSLGANPSKEQIKVAKKADARWVNLSAWIRNFNCDRKYYIAVKYLDGTFGNMCIGAGAYNDVKDCIDKMGEEKTISPKEGCFFEFSRGVDSSGKTVYSAKPYSVEVNVDGEALQKRVKAPLVQDDVEKISRFCMDLNHAHATPVLTEVQIQQLVDNGEGNLELVDTIMDAAQTTLHNVIELAPGEVNQAKPTAPGVVEVKRTVAPVASEDSGLDYLRAATKHKSVTVATPTEQELMDHLSQ